MSSVKSSAISLFPILFTVFLDSLGFGLVFPIFSSLIMNETEGFLAPSVSVATRGLIFGCLVSSFCVGQFFGSPFLGALSDRKGRKKILVYTLWLASFSYLLATFGILFHSLAALLIARIGSGFAAGNYSIAQSIVADASAEESKAKNFGLLGMAWGLGFIIGPYVGGKLSDPGPLFGEGSFSGSFATPFWVASLLCLINVFMLIWKLKETLHVKKETPFSFLLGIQHIKKAFQLPILRGLFLVIFIFSAGWGFFTEFSPIFLISCLKFDRGEIGSFYAWVGIWVALCQGVIIRPFLKKFAPYTLLVVSLFGLALALASLLLVETGVGFFWTLPLLALPEAFISPTSATLISNLSDKDSQGEMLGIYNSVQWAAIGLAPLVSGSLVALYPHLPMTVGSICMVIAGCILFFGLKRNFVTVKSN